MQIAALKARETLARPSFMPTTVEEVKSLDADVVFIRDAYPHPDLIDEQSQSVIDTAKDRLDRAGYNMKTVTYSHRLDPAMLMLSRLAIDYETIKLGHKEALEARLRSNEKYNELYIVGGNLHNQAQLEDFVINYIDEVPTVLIGNLHSRNPSGQVLNSLPVSMAERNKRERVSSLVKNLQIVASGVIYDTLTREYGYQDADPLGRAAPNHILVSPNVIVNEFSVVPAKNSRVLYQPAIKADINW